MTTEEKPEKLRKPGWENYQRFGRKGWLLKKPARQKTREKTHRSVKNHWTQKNHWV